MREGKGWSQARLAEECGATFGKISSWERQKSEPSLREITALCLALDASADWLIRGTGPRRPEVPAAIVDERGTVSARRMLIALVFRADLEARFWQMSAPLLEQADAANESDRRRIQALVEKMAFEWGIDLKAGPPDKQLLRFVAENRETTGDPKRASKGGPVSLTLHAPPVQRDGFVEERAERITFKPGAGKKQAEQRRKRKTI